MTREQQLLADLDATLARMETFATNLRAVLGVVQPAEALVPVGEVRQGDEVFVDGAWRKVLAWSTGDGETHLCLDGIGCFEDAADHTIPCRRAA